ncbi:MAG: HU family DNA-binding protein [Patescibacteria group bacterium]|jgi:DNA-binding protein HU-beta
MAKMTKSQMLQSLADSTQMSKKDLSTVLEALTSLVYKEVKTNGECTIPGIGKLVKKHRSARQGRNPATGATIQIPAKTVVKFRVSKAAKDAIL